MARRREEKKSLFSKNNLIGLFIIVVMVASGLAMWEGGESNSFKYNGYKFSGTDSYITTKINNTWVKFYHMPAPLENISIDKAAIEKIKNSKVIYLTFDPKDKNIQSIEVIRIDLEQNDLPTYFNIFVTPGTINNIAPYASFNKITCENATDITPVLYLTTSNETTISMENNCIYIKGTTGYDIQAMKDRLLYGMFGIIK